jgi:hypothetical protein
MLKAHAQIRPACSGGVWALACAPLPTRRDLGAACGWHASRAHGAGLDVAAVRRHHGCSCTLAVARCDSIIADRQAAPTGARRARRRSQKFCSERYWEKPATAPGQWSWIDCSAFRRACGMKTALSVCSHHRRSAATRRPVAAGCFTHEKNEKTDPTRRGGTAGSNALRFDVRRT